MSPPSKPPRDNKDAQRARPVAVNAGVHGQRYAHFKIARRALNLRLLLLILWATEYLSGSESPWGCFRINLNATSVFHLALTIEDIDVGSASQNTTASGCKFQNKAPVFRQNSGLISGQKSNNTFASPTKLHTQNIITCLCFFFNFMSSFFLYLIIDSGHPWSGSGQVAGNNQTFFFIIMIL